MAAFSNSDWGNTFGGTNSTQTTFTFGDNPLFIFTTGTATPNVGGKNRLQAANTSAITITNFNGGVNGQSLMILGDGYTTLQQNSTIANTGGSNTLLASGSWYHYIKINGVWTQFS
jgi:hypothetical protein